MADKTWIGTDGAWGTGANWSPVATVPVNGDDVYIVSGSDDITGSDQSAVTLDSLTVGSQFTGSIGASDAKMQINATEFDYAGSGTSAYFDGNLTTATIQNTSTDDDALHISTSAITTLRILGGSGTVQFASTCNISTTIEQIGADSVTTIIADATTIGGACTLTMDSGRFELNQAVPTITTFGGELVATLDSGTVTTLNMYGGRVRWNPTEACTLTTLNLYNGLFDSRDSLSPTFTVTNATIHSSGTINEQSGLANAVWTNPLSMEGGEILYDTGRTVTIS